MKQLFETDTTIEERFGKCPFATVQSLISGKWAILILHYLEDGPVRFNELQRLMPKMTHATLSVQLKNLVENGLVERKQYESVPNKSGVLFNGNRKRISSCDRGTARVGREIY